MLSVLLLFLLFPPLVAGSSMRPSIRFAFSPPLKLLFCSQTTRAKASFFSCTPNRAYVRKQYTSSGAPSDLSVKLRIRHLFTETLADLKHCRLTVPIVFQRKLVRPSVPSAVIFFCFSFVPAAK